MKTKRAVAVVGAVLVGAAGFFFNSTFSSQAQFGGGLRPPRTNSFFFESAFAWIPGGTQAVSNLLTSPAPAASGGTLAPVRMPSGTYWSLRGLTNRTSGPLPSSPFGTNVPVYALGSNQFVFDDRSVDYSELERLAAAEAATSGLRASSTPPPSPADLDASGALWVEIPPDGLAVANQLRITLHNTTGGQCYQILTKQVLTDPLWTLEQSIAGAAGTVTPAQLFINNRTNLFIRSRAGCDLVIFQQPLSQEVFSGDTVTFSVVATGSGLSYQWTMNGTNIYGATGSSFTIQGVNANNAGDYACIIQNTDETVTTQAATLIVAQGSGWPYDMSTVGQRQDYTFRSGITYTITSPIELFGRTRIEGGAIIKFDYTFPFPCLLVMGTLDCEGGAYNPAILTSVDDDTFGGTESYGAPQPVFTGVPFLDLTYAGDVSLSNLRFRYADMAVGAPYFARLDVWDCQFVQCFAGVVNEFGGTDSFHNVLFSGCMDAVAGNTNSYAVEMEQVTADATNLWYSGVSPSRLALTNSIIFGNVGSVSAYSAQSVTFAPNTTEFQTNGTGNYYLAAASSLRQSGTTNISPRLRSEFQQKTTAPPLAFPQQMNLAGDLTLMPQVPRYTNGAPDRGYYYDALDYTVAWMTVSGSITIEPGTTIGIRNEPIPGVGHYTWWGFDLRENSSIISHGMPNRPNIIADTQTVQEQDEYASTSLFVPDFQGSPSDAAPTMNFRFNKLYAPAGGYQVWGGDWEFAFYFDYLASYDSLVNWTMRDCELHGGRISLGLPDISMDLTLYYGAGAVDWENNLFESVNIYLNPASWWWNGVVNFDESFTARNNLFKGANWMAIEPVPASAGNWTFTDNLFDGIDFRVDAAAPMDFGFNGYHPLPASQTLSTTMPHVLSVRANDSTTLVSATNNLGGLHEVFMDYALPYANGAFGNYYLSTITPLWQAGSRTAADAGLSQYTTFANQAKDTGGQPVNIGLHYVAATNSLPLDTDGDGVPDYVEVEHGTDLYNAMTDGVTNDTYNAAYDDVDLSGNGLVGRIKKALGINPLNPSNPLTLKQVITGEEPDIASFELQISYDIATSSGTLNLHINGIDVTFGDCIRATNGNCILRLDIDYDPPGLHYLSAEFRQGTEPETAHPILAAGGAIQPFYSSNTVQFFESGSMFDDTGAYLDAKIFVQNADYTIELYNPSTIPPTFILEITNSTSTGIIQENWGATNADGTAYAGTTVNAVFYVTPAANAANTPANTPANIPANRPTKILTRAKGSLSEWGPNFDVAYFYTPTNNSMEPAFAKGGGVWSGIQSLVDTLTMPNATYTPYNSGFDHYTCYYCGPGETPYPGYITSQATITNILYPDMTNGLTKQFYCYAHGSSNHIGNWTGDAYMKASEISRLLQNTYTGTNFATQNPYRFVFLDGCSTASASNWRRAFGIYALDEGALAGRNKVGPQAYVGWAKDHAGWLNVSSDNTQALNLNKAYTQTLNNFYSDWMHNTSLNECIDHASLSLYGTAPLPVPQNENVLVYGNGFFYSGKGIDTSRIYIVGHPGLTVDGVNGQADNDKTYAAPINTQ